MQHINKLMGQYNTSHFFFIFYNSLWEEGPVGATAPNILLAQMLS